MLARLFRSLRSSGPSALRTVGRSFDAAPSRLLGSERRRADVSPFNLTSAPLLRTRARHFYRTNAYASAGAGTLTSSMVGYGITPAPQHPDDRARRWLSESFQTFARHAGVNGEPFAAICEDAVRAMIVDGDTFLRFVETADGLRLQPLPAEQADEGKTLDLATGWIESGIEFDADGRRVAYHVFPHRAGDPFATRTDSVRIPADDIIHLFRRDRPGQVRGISWFAPVLQRLAELDKLEDAIAVGVQVAAMHAGVLVDMNGTGTIPYDGAQAGSIMESGLEPGTLKVLPGGYDIRFSTPQQAPHAVQVAEHEIRAIAVGLGVPAHLVSGDVSKANYSSLRADMNAFRARLEAWQWNLLIPQLCQPVWERVIRHAALTQ